MTTLPLFYSAIVFSLSAIIGIVLAYNIILLRRSEGIGLGDGDNSKMRKRMRAQANFLEYLLPFAILYVIYELNGGNEITLMIVGGAFIFARIIHPLGLYKSAGTSNGRFFGTLITWLAILFLAGANLYLLI